MQCQYSDGVTVASFNAPRVDDAVRLAVVADTHLCENEDSYQKVYRPTSVFERVVKDINDRDVDATVSVGDLTLEGRKAEYGLVESAIAHLDAPFVSVPGNHDVRKTFDSHPGIPVTEFADRYAPDGLPFATDIGGQTILGLDSASAAEVSDSHDGFVGESQTEWLDRRLGDGGDPIVFVHHNLPGAIDQFDDYRQAADPSLGTPPVLEAPAPLVDVLSAHDVSLVLSGHLHLPMVATSSGVRELLVPSTATFPQGYYLLDVEPTGTDVRYVPVTSVAEAREAAAKRRSLRPKAAALCEMAAARLSTLPLHDEATTGQ